MERFSVLSFAGRASRSIWWKSKFWFFKRSLLVLGVAFLAALVAAWCKNWHVIAAILGFGYFFNQQKVAETRVLWDILHRFNARYARMRFPAPGDEWPRKNVIDYLNLCAEEYALYDQGYVPPKIWETWRLGMQEKLKPLDDRSQKIVQKELGNGRGYYGLTWNIIFQGERR